MILMVLFGGLVGLVAARSRAPWQSGVDSLGGQIGCPGSWRLVAPWRWRSIQPLGVASPRP